MYDQVYGGYRRRPAMISLNVQWMPVNDRSGAYQWGESDASNRKVKTVTFFGTGEMRGQQRAKVTTPPGSDYTDAYLSAFASKPIPTRHVHRLSTAVFDNSAPIPLKPISIPLSTSSSMQTSQTRFINTNNIQTSNLFDKPIPSSSNQSSTYSSSFVPERSTTYEPFSSTPYSLPQSQTFTSSYSTLLRSPTSTVTSISSPSVDSQRSYTTFSTRSQPPLSTYPTVYRSETAYENIYKPMPPYSIQSYPPSNTYTTSLSSLSTESTYKPYVPSQSVPLSSYNINQTNTTEHIVQPTMKIEKQIDRPETLLFQHDEDIRSSRIEKPLSAFSPSPESPIIREELKVEPERLQMEDLSTTTSEPIQILENTLSKYDSLINQISEVLASVSPLSSTASSMSPGKNVLDYQLSSDSSPILPHKRIESEPSQESTTTSTVKSSSNIQRTKPSHLIRDDSYDKIVTAISDLDNEVISPSDAQNSSSTIKEEVKTPSLDESQVPLITEEEKVDSNISSLPEDQKQSKSEQEKEEEVKTPSIIEEQVEEMQTTSMKEQQSPAVAEEEIKNSSLEDYQTSSITEDQKKEETQTASVDEHQTTSTIEDITEERKASSTNEQETPSVTEEDAKTSLIEKQQVPSVSKEDKEEEEAKTSSADEAQTPSITKEEHIEETKNVPEDEHQASPSIKEEKDQDAKIALTDEVQASSITEEEKKEEPTTISLEEHSTILPAEEKKEEILTSSTDESQTQSITEEETKNVPEDEHPASPLIKEEKDQETKTTLTDEVQASSIGEEEKKEERTTISLDEHSTISPSQEKQEETKNVLEDEHPASPLIKEEKDQEAKITLTDEVQASSITEEDKKKEPTTISLDEHSTILPAKEKKEEIVTSLTDEHQLSSASDEEKVEIKLPSPENEETKIVSFDEQQTPSVIKEETEIVLSDEQQASSVPEESQNLSAASPSDTLVSEVIQPNETKPDEEKVPNEQLTVETTSENVEFAQQQTGLLATVPNDVPVTEKLKETSVNAKSTRKSGKRVTWDETVIDNEDDESSSDQSLTEESDTPDQQLTSPDITELQTTSTEQQISPSSHTEDQTNLQATINEQVHQTDILEPQIIPLDSIEQVNRSLSPSETSSALPDPTNEQVISSDLTESQVSLNEQQIYSTNSTDTQSVSVIDSSKDDTSTVDEASTTISGITGTEDSSKSAEESEVTKIEPTEEATIDKDNIETSSQVAESAPSESETSVIENTNSSLQSTIASPIDTLADTVANRYISSDVYHGYMGEHKKFLQDVSDNDDDSTTKSLLASLRETITTPITPLIETIQSVVSSMQTTPGTRPLNTDDETRLTTASVTESKEEEEVSDDKIQVGEDTSTVNTSETLKTVFENLREAVTAPITAITETIQTAVSNLQSDTHEVPSTSDTEQLTTPLEENISTIETESFSNIVSPFDDHSNKEIEQTQSSLLDSIQEKVSKTITTLTETIQNVVSTNSSAAETDIEDKQNVQQEKSDTTVSTSSDTTSSTAEQTNEQKENQETMSSESSPSEIPELISAVPKPEESTTESVELTSIVQPDEPVSTVSSTTVEEADIPNKQETIPIDATPVDIPLIPSADHKSDELLSTDDKTIESAISTSVTQHDEQVSTPTITPFEQIDITDKQEVTPSEISSEPSVEQKLDENVSTETKTTLEVIRDAITHPLATISEKIQSILPASVSEQTEPTTSDAAETSKERQISETENNVTIEQKTHSIVDVENAEPSETKSTLETIRDVITHPLATLSGKIQSVISTSNNEHVDQASSDATTSSVHTPEQMESSEKQSSLETADATIVEQKPDSTLETENVESTHAKTAFETFRDVITHPLATITEKIQSVISSSAIEEVPSLEQQSSTTTIDQKKNEDISSTVTESTLETIPDTITNPSTSVNETVENDVSNTTDQTSLSQEKEQILTNQGSELYLLDQIQGKQEISTTTIPSQISDNEKTTQRTDSESERITNTETQDSVSHKTEDAITSGDQSTSDTNKLLIINNTIRDLINDTVNTVISNLSRNTIENEQKINEETFSSTSSLTSPTTVINAEDRTESSQSTTNQEAILNEDDITWSNLLGEKSADEKLNQSYEEIKQLLEEVVQSSDNITEDQTQPLPVIENSTQQTLVTPQNDDIMQRSSNELESDSISAVTEIEKVSSKLPTDFREPSPSNTEDDSLELIHALHGHSIILPSSPLLETQTTTNQPSISTSTIEKNDEQTLQGPEKSSSSTTTSSQVTSSDRYVSYAIHEMGDSSQERLPAFPIAADIPVYEVKTTSDETKEQQILSEPIVDVNQTTTKDDDLTELDATENLTSYSDDILLQKLNASNPNRQENLDASSTDEDVDDENFNEFEQPDVSNLHRIVEEMTQPNNSSSGDYGHTYQRYDLSSNSSTSTKPQTDDVYIIPGYPGLWRPSADDDDDTHSSFANDADDEDEKKQANTTVKTRTVVRTTDPAKLQSFSQQQQPQNIPLRPDTIDIFNRPLNEFSFDLSESDSFKTCASTINSSSLSKQQKQSELAQIPISEQKEHQLSPEEKIFLIRERERGVSLPVTMKIDYDDMALRLSASTPFDTQLYSPTQTDLPSPSAYSEPIEKTTSGSRASTPSLSSNESEQQKPSSSSWLNTINTITTTTEGPDGPLESRTTIHKSAKGPISIAECDATGKYIIIENTSRSKSIALGTWKIRQENDNGDILTFTFPDNCLLRPNHSLKVFTKSNESERRNSDLIASSLSSWHTGSNVVTTLINADGKDRASLTKKTLFS